MSGSAGPHRCTTQQRLVPENDAKSRLPVHSHPLSLKSLAIPVQPVPAPCASSFGRVWLGRPTRKRKAERATSLLTLFTSSAARSSRAGWAGSRDSLSTVGQGRQFPPSSSSSLSPTPTSLVYTQDPCLPGLIAAAWPGLDPCLPA